MMEFTNSKLFDRVVASLQAPAAPDLSSVMRQDTSAMPPDVLAKLAADLFTSETLATEELADFATERVRTTGRGIETFVPIFISNFCDAECKMCGMRVGNTALDRKYAGRAEIQRQLEFLHDGENVRACGFLTGEHADPYLRHLNAFKVGWAIAEAFRIGFKRVYINIGSMTSDEIATLAEWVAPERRHSVTLCVFQETYDPVRYAKIIGDDPKNPKAQYERRITSFDRWLDAGFRQVNPGILIGLTDTRADLASLVYHVAQLRRRHADVVASMPRVRPALGTSERSKVGDDEYLRALAVFTILFPSFGVVLTTREDASFQKRAVSFIRCISPGSPDVAPYGLGGLLRNDESSSQFLIPDRRSPSQVLMPFALDSRAIEYFEPGVNK